MAFEKGKWVLQQARSGGWSQGSSAFPWSLCCRHRGHPGCMGSLLCWAITLLYPESQQRPLAIREMGAQTDRHLRIWSRKISREFSLQARSREDQRAGSRGAPALLFVCSGCSCSAWQQQVQGAPRDREASPADPAACQGWSRHWKQMKQLLAKTLAFITIVA